MACYNTYLQFLTIFYKQNQQESAYLVESFTSFLKILQVRVGTGRKRIPALSDSGYRSHNTNKTLICEMNLFNNTVRHR